MADKTKADNEAQGRKELAALKNGAGAFDDPAKLRALALQASSLAASYPGLAAEIAQFENEMETMLTSIEEKEERAREAARGARGVRRGRAGRLRRQGIGNRQATAAACGGEGRGEGR